VSPDALTTKCQGLFDHLRARFAKDPECFAGVSFWELEEGCEWLIDVNVEQIVYVREVYKMLFSNVLARFATYGGISVGTSVVGNPGTGKSCFLIYCLVMFLFPPPNATYERKSVFFWISLNQHGFYFDASTFEVTKYENFDYVPGLSSAETVCLYDGARKLAWQKSIPSFVKLAVAALSPSLNNNDQWDRAVAVRAYATLWDLETELLPVGKRLGFDEAHLRRMHRYFGGIARYVVQKDPAKIRSNWFLIREAVNDPDSVSAGDAGLYNSDIARTMTHSVFAMIPSSDLAFISRVDFVSPMIRSLYVNALQVRMKDDISKFLTDYQHSNLHAAVWGKVFESYAHQHLIRGDTVDVEWFKDSEKTTTRAFKARQFKSPIVFSTLDDICNVATAHASENLYFIPQSKTFEGLDAIARSDGQWFGLQMTKNKNHDIKKARLDKLRNLLLEKKVVQDVKFPFATYWVVPSHLFQSFPVQKLKTSKGKDFVKRPSIKVFPCGKIGLRHDRSRQLTEPQLLGDPGSPLDEATDTDDLLSALS